MTIGAVISILQQEFPAITVSKLRFLEDQGLVNPTRTGSGYRKFSQADVARLRYTLTQQRDHYRPLKVIKEQLEELDAGRDVEEHRTARVVSRNGSLVTPAGGARITVRELAELTGVSVAHIEEIVTAGVLVKDRRGRLSSHSIGAVGALGQLSRSGLDARHLRTMRSNAENIAELVENVVAPSRSQKSPVARERAAAHATEMGEHAATLYAHLIRVAIDDEHG